MCETVTLLLLHFVCHADVNIPCAHSTTLIHIMISAGAPPPPRDCVFESDRDFSCIGTSWDYSPCYIFDSSVFVWYVEKRL